MSTILEKAVGYAAGVTPLDETDVLADVINLPEDAMVSGDVVARILGYMIRQEVEPVKRRVATNADGSRVHNISMTDGYSIREKTRQ